MLLQSLIPVLLALDGRRYLPAPLLRPVEHPLRLDLLQPARSLDHLRPACLPCHDLSPSMKNVLLIWPKPHRSAVEPRSSAAQGNVHQATQPRLLRT